MLTFDPKNHQYFYDSHPVPSVTQVLGAVGIPDLSKVNREILEEAMIRGTNIHKICELWDNGTLDNSSVNDAGRRYLDQWIAAKKDLGIDKFDMVEKLVYHSKLGYAGTLDRVSDTTMIDIKTGEFAKSAGPQTAAYVDALKPDTKIKKRLVVSLTPDSYKIKPFTNRADFNTFLSALNIWRFKNGK